MVKIELTVRFDTATVSEGEAALRLERNIEHEIQRGLLSYGLESAVVDGYSIEALVTGASGVHNG